MPPSPTTPLPAYTPQQHELFARVLSGLRDLRSAYKPLKQTIPPMVFSLCLGAALAYLWFAAVHWVLSWFSSQPDWVYYVAGVVPVLFLLLAVVTSKISKHGWDEKIRMPADPTSHRLHFDRLGMAVD